MDEAALSAREAEVAQFYVDGLSYKEIARALEISPGTVRTHLNSIYRKLAVSSRTELARRLQSAAAAQAEKAAPAFAPEKTRSPERRQITFLFGDIVGSTELASRLDAEDMRDLLTRFRTVVREELKRFGGHAAGFPGDGAIAVFGWPEATEDAPRRAARAALAITAAAKRVAVATGETIAVRAGVATGLVIVEGGEGRADDFTGTAANLAARLQTLAPSGGVVVSVLTRELIGGRFETEPLGEAELHGFADPVPIFHLLRERPDLTRFETRRHGRRASPLLGREAELKILRELWRDVAVGRGAGALLVGEAGIGKSRLAESLADEAAEDGATLLRMQTGEGRSSSPLWPVRMAISTAANLDPDAPTAERLAVLESWLDSVTGARPLQRTLVAHLMGLAGDDELPEMSASRRRDYLLDSLVAIFRDLSRQAPMVALLEDMHWTDPTTLDFAARLLREAPTVPLLLMMTSRPTGEPAFEEATPLRMPLAPLGREDAERLVRERAEGERLDDDTITAIIARTDGIPLYLEEVTAAVLDGAAGRDTVPATLRESLAARLDRLGPAREIAQVAAAIGREVDIDLLSAVAAGAVEADLARLVEAGLAFRARRRITFSHALVQDAAYQSMLRCQRQALHGRIAEAMLGRFRNRFAGEPESLAQHLERAGRMAAAIDYYLRAADAAGARAANREAEGYARRAHELAEMMEGGAERDRREVAALQALGRIFSTRYGYGREEVAEPMRRALSLCQTSGMRRTEFPLVVALAVQAGVAGNTMRSLELAERAKTLADASGNSAHLVMAGYAMGVARCWRGERLEAAAVFGTGAEAYDADMHSVLLSLGPHDSGIVCLSRGAANRFLVAPAREELVKMDAAISLARTLGHSHSLNYALHWSTMQAIDALEWNRAESSFAEAIDLAEAHDFATWRSMGSVCEARLAAERLSPAEALDAARRSLAALPEGGNLCCMSFVMGLAGEALRRLGRRSEARVQLEAAVAEAERRATRWGLPETLRALARCLLEVDSGDTSGAEAALLRSVALSRRQGSLLQEVRAATDLAELLLEQGDRKAARKTIEAPINAISATAPAYDRERGESVLLAAS